MANKNLNLIFNAKDNVSGVLRGISGKLKKQQKAFSSLAVVGGGAFAGIGFAMKSVISYAGELEQQTVAFETMLGSGEKATKMLKDLSDFAMKTPFELRGIRNTAKQLMAMGIESGKVISTLKALGDVASGTGAPLERIALNFGQVKTQGKLTGRELRDFAVNGVPLIEELAKQFGVTKSAIQDMTSAGKIGFADVEKAFIGMSSEGGKFANLMDKQSKTFNGIVSNLKDSIGKTAEDIGKQLLPQVKELAEKILVVVERIQEWVKNNPELTAKIIKLSLVLSGLTFALGTIGFILPSVIAGFEALMGPVGLIALAIGLVVANWDKLVAVWEKVKSMLEDMGVIQMFKDMWDSIVGTFRDELLPELKKFWELVGPILTPVLEFLGKVVGGVLVIAIYALMGAVKLLVVLFTKLIQFINWLLDGFKKVGSYVAEKLTNYFKDVASGIEYVVEKVHDLLSALKRLKDNVGGGIEVVMDFFRGKRGRRSVNDAIITNTGEVITTHPDDHLIATKDPQSLIGGSGATIIINNDFTNASLLSEDAGEQISQMIMKRVQLQMRGVRGL